MATVQGVTDYPQRGTVRVTWSNLGNGDDGDWEAIARWPDKSFTVSGTFGAGGTVVFEGPSDGNTLNDTAGNALSLTTAATKQVMENPWQVRPSVTAGDGTTDLTIVVIGVRSN